MSTFCFDLNGTLDTYPNQIGTMMRGLRALGHRVVILSAAGNEPEPTPERIRVEMGVVEHLGCADCYDAFVLVGSGPEGDVDKDVVAANKVAYLQSVDAVCLVDNEKTNVKAARDAGFLALRVY